ncbi:MAG: hypothetical protein ABI114_14250, partial [Rhodanobacter sp.]
ALGLMPSRTGCAPTKIWMHDAVVGGALAPMLFWVWHQSQSIAAKAAPTKDGRMMPLQKMAA